MAKNPPTNARDMGSIPGQRTKIIHATGQLNLHTTTRETTCHNQRKLVSCNKDPATKTPATKKKNFRSNIPKSFCKLSLWIALSTNIVVMIVTE